MVPATVGAKDARAMFSVDGGESFSSYSVRKPASATVAVASSPSTNGATEPNRQESANTITMPTTRAPLSDGIASAIAPAAANAAGGDLTKRAIEAFRGGSHDSVLAFGGGSGLDAAKAIAFMARQELPIWHFDDVFGIVKTLQQGR